MLSLLELLFWLLIGLLASFYFFYFSLMMSEAKKPSTHSKRKIFPQVSLVVAAHNEEAVIIQRLDNIKQLKYPKDKLEVIIVDDGSTDDTGEKVAQYKRQDLNELDLRLITLPKWSGKASALNYAWQVCKGKIVVISDADTPLEKNAINRIVRNFNDQTVGAVSGKQVIVNSTGSSMTKLERSYRGIFEILRVGESNMDSTPIFNGPIVAFRRNLLNNIDSDSQADDIELCVKIREKGYRAVYDPEAIAYAQVPTGFINSIRQKSRRARGIIQSFLRHRKMLFNSEYGKYGSVIFPCEFFMCIISPILFALVFVLGVINLLLNPMMLTHFLILCGILMGVSVVLFVASKAKINPLAFLSTFLSHELFLILGLVPILMGKTSYKWEKTRDYVN